MQLSLPEARIPFSVRAARVVPRYHAEHDYPWLRALVEELERFVGKKQRDLERRMLEPFPFAAPSSKLRAAIHVATRLWGYRQQAAVPPRRARAAVFAMAARGHVDTDQVIAHVASDLGVSAAGLRASLFADLPGERVVGPQPDGLSPPELALRTNLAIVQALLLRSSGVRIRITGNVRVIVRQARLNGLICTVGRADGEQAIELQISGPYSLFRRTQLYGRSLSQLVPLLSWCDRFVLEAHCLVRGEELVLELGSGDPVFPAREPHRFDSQLEERFARDFGRVAPEWDILREPEPVMAGRTMVFPDFALQNRLDGRRWLLEIVGFWTPDYLGRKLAHYREAKLSRFILCIDESRNCATEAMPKGASVIPFHRRIDPLAVLAAVKREPSIPSALGMNAP